MISRPRDYNSLETNVAQSNANGNSSGSIISLSVPDGSHVQVYQPYQFEIMSLSQLVEKLELVLYRYNNFGGHLGF